MTQASKRARSAVSNGSTHFVLSEVDGRGPLARRFKDLIEDFTDQAGGSPTAAQNALIRRAATLALQCEIDECALASGNEINSDAYARRANTLGHVLAKAGLCRMATDKLMKTIDAHTSALMDGAL